MKYISWHNLTFRAKLLVGTTVYILLSTLFYSLTSPYLRFSGIENDIQIVSNGITPSLKPNNHFEQIFNPNTSGLKQVSFKYALLNPSRKNEYTITITDNSNTTLYSRNVSSLDMGIDGQYIIDLYPYLEIPSGSALRLKVASDSQNDENSIAFYYNDEVKEQYFLLNGEELEGCLSLTTIGTNIIPYKLYYMNFVLLVGICAFGYIIYAYQSNRHGKITLLYTLISAKRRYGFLLSQLVARDFKVKYKKSALGILWSLLNPLITMLVQYIVFAQLFRFNIPHYPVYLLSGIVFFNFMSDTTSQAMCSIVQNAPLINKVYVPKYIYPFSRILSCGINTLFSMVSLYLVIIINGVNITINYIFIMFAVVCLFMFVCGVSLFLSSLMVFFRDIFFLYSVILQIWMYMTPLFYAEDILPQWVLFIVKFNPMYHYIRFIRQIVLTGGLPEAKAWIICAFFSIISFIIGSVVFKKTQNKFVLYM